MIRRLKKAARLLRPGAFFRGTGRYKASMRHSDDRAMRFLAKSHRTNRSFRRETGFPPSRLQDGRLPVL
jgi:hypothetical protein